MIKFNLADTDGRPANFKELKNSENGNTIYLLTASPKETDSLFKSISGTTAATTTITSPTPGGFISLTDIIISAEKKNTGTLELRFTDDVNTISIFKATLTDAPVNLAVPLNGAWAGWKNGRLEVITIENFVYTVAVGYIKHREGLNYSDWDARR